MVKKNLNVYKNNCNVKLKYLLSKADRLGFNDTDSNNDSFKLLRYISEDFDKEFQKNFEYANIVWDMLNIFKNLNNKNELHDLYENMCCGTISKDGYYDYYEFITFLKEKMKEKKIIYLFSDLTGYGVDDDDYDPNYEYDEEDLYHLHGCSIILIPKDNYYKMFYINSHGRDMLDTNEFEIRISRTRRKKIRFNTAIDIVMLKNFVNYINEFHETSIVYSGKKYDTYFGANLQAGDDHGICFIYPFVIYYCLGVFYNSKMAEGGVFDTAKNLLHSNRLIDFVHYCFVDYSPDLYNIFTLVSDEKDRINDMEICLEKLSYRLIKNVLYSILSYTNQSYFRKFL